MKERAHRYSTSHCGAQGFIWFPMCLVFLRADVYERLVPLGRKPTFYHLVLTQLVSGVWHGVFAGYWLFFATSALMFRASHVLHRYERNWPQNLRSFLPWRLLKIAMTAFVLNYAGSAFMVLSYGEAIRIWSTLYYFGHIIIALLLLISAVLPPRSKPPKIYKSKAENIAEQPEPSNSGPATDASTFQGKKDE